MTLEARNLARRVLIRGQERDLLRPTSFRIAAGEVLGITGPSGAGKSILLRLLSGLDPRSWGDVFLDGQAVTPRDLPRFRRDVLMVSQNPPWGAVTPLALFREARRFRVRAQRTAAVDLLIREAEALGLPGAALSIPGDRLDRATGRLAWLAMAGALRPRFFLLDDPAAGFDQEARLRLAEWIRAKARAGAGFLVGSGDEILLARTARHLLILYDGAVQAEGPPEMVIPAAVAEARRSGR